MAARHLTRAEEEQAADTVQSHHDYRRYGTTSNLNSPPLQTVRGSATTQHESGLHGLPRFVNVSQNTPALGLWDTTPTVSVASSFTDQYSTIPTVTNAGRTDTTYGTTTSLGDQSLPAQDYSTNTSITGPDSTGYPTTYRFQAEGRTTLCNQSTQRKHRLPTPDTTRPFGHISRKRSRFPHIPLEEAIPEQSSAASPTQYEVPKRWADHFRSWLHAKPGASPNLKQIQAFVELTDLSYDTIHRWFYGELQRSAQTVQSPAQHAPSVAEPVLATRESRDTYSHSTILSICRRAAQEYGIYRPKCTERKSAIDIELNRQKSWDPMKRYSCTSACGEIFSRKSDWMRHEKGNHVQEGWICNLGRTCWDGSGTRCTFCPCLEPDSEHVELSHDDKIPCDTKDLSDGNGGRVFIRKDKMKEHLHRVHGHLDPSLFEDACKFTTTDNFPSRCGFCGCYFSTWKEWVDHVGNHFEEKATLNNWQDPWVDPLSPQPPHDDDDGDGDDNDGDNDGGGKPESDGEDSQDPPNSSSNKGPNDRNFYPDEDADDPSSIFFDYNRYYDCAELYELLKQFLMGGTATCITASDARDGPRQRILEFLRTNSSPNAPLLFRLNDDETKLCVMSIPKSKIFRGQPLGFGGMGSVHQASIGIHTLQRPLALKESNHRSARPEDQVSLLREFFLLNCLRHSHIVRSMGILLKPYECGLLMPLADRSLRDLLKHNRKSLDLSSGDFGCLASAVEHMHGRDIIHGDLKPENILIVHEGDGHRLLLSDYGSSYARFATGPLSNSGKGFTPKYAAPETARDQPHTKASDIFSLGCVFLEILMHLTKTSEQSPSFPNPPFPDTDRELSYHSALSQVHSWLSAIERLQRPVSDKGQSGPLDMLNSAQITTIREMLESEPHKRPSAGGIPSRFPTRECCRQPRDQLNVQPSSTGRTTRISLAIPLDSRARCNITASPFDRHPPKKDCVIQAKSRLRDHVLLPDYPRTYSMTASSVPRQGPKPYTTSASESVAPGEAISRTSWPVYQSLNPEREEIRLMRFGAPTMNETICCYVDKFELQTAPEYVALSYAWGDPSTSNEIFLNDHLVSVTANLYAALQQLQKRSTGYLWVDAICINSSDCIERSSQVALMSRLYGSADSVIVWLGTAESSSKFSLRYLAELAKGPDLTGSIPLLKQEYHISRKSYQSPARAEISVEHKSFRALRSALQSLTSRSWFSRTWVLQELVLARVAHVQWGQETLSWDDLYDAVAYLERSNVGFKADEMSTRWTGNCRDRSLLRSTVSILYRRLSVFQALRDYKEQPSLIELLERLRGYKTTDPRDTIYAVLGLATDTMQLGIYPDYSKASYEVYTDVAVRLLMNYKSLDLLASSEFQKHQTGLPSWVPDWSGNRRTSRLGWSFYSASADTVAKVEFENGRSTLHATGIFVDTLEEISIPWGLRQSTRNTLKDVATAARRFLLDVERLIIPEEFRHSKHRNAAEVIWRTSIADRELAENGRWRKSVFSYNAYRETVGYRHETRSVTKKMTKKRLGDDTFLGPDAKRFHATLSIRCESRRAFVTKQGYLGLGPDVIEVGDVVVILFGAPVPFIIRETVGGRYQLIGECYVDGIMNGEMMAKASRSTVIILE